METPSRSSTVRTVALVAAVAIATAAMMPEAFEEGGRPIALLTALGFAVAAVPSTAE